jgi:hypothetical protein
MSDPYNDYQGVQGYIKATVEVIGPHDIPVISEFSDDVNAQATVFDSNIDTYGFQIICEVYRAENVIPQGFVNEKKDYVVRLRYSGISAQTRP